MKSFLNVLSSSLTSILIIDILWLYNVAQEPYKLRAFLIIVFLAQIVIVMEVLSLLKLSGANYERIQKSVLINIMSAAILYIVNFIIAMITCLYIEDWVMKVEHNLSAGFLVIAMFGIGVAAILIEKTIVSIFALIYVGKR